jgi:hypothetical protein
MASPKPDATREHRILCTTDVGREALKMLAAERHVTTGGLLDAYVDALPTRSRSVRRRASALDSPSV